MVSVSRSKRESVSRMRAMMSVAGVGVGAIHLAGTDTMTFWAFRDTYDAAEGSEAAAIGVDVLLRLHAAGGGLGKAPGAAHLWRDHPGRLSRTDERYGLDRFRSLKCEVLAAHVLRGRLPVVCGAGPTGKAFSKALDGHGLAPSAFVDLDPRKSGQTIPGAPVVHPRDLGPPAGRFALAAVSGAGPRREVRATLEGLGWAEERDFLAVA